VPDQAADCKHFGGDTRHEFHVKHLAVTSLNHSIALPDDRS